MLTGESAAVPKPPGTRVHQGTHNLATPVRVRVTAVAGNTVLSGIVALLERAQAEQASARSSVASVSSLSVKVLSSVRSQRLGFSEASRLTTTRMPMNARLSTRARLPFSSLPTR